MRHVWRIVVRFDRDSAWRPVWAATGRRAEAEGCTRFVTICALFTGEWDEEHNDHAQAWTAARVLREELIVEECDRDASRSAKYDTVLAPRDGNE